MPEWEKETNLTGQTQNTEHPAKLYTGTNFNAGWTVGQHKVARLEPTSPPAHLCRGPHLKTGLLQEPLYKTKKTLKLTSFIQHEKELFTKNQWLQKLISTVHICTNRIRSTYQLSPDICTCRTSHETFAVIVVNAIILHVYVQTWSKLCSKSANCEEYEVSTYSSSHTI